MLSKKNIKKYFTRLVCVVLISNILLLIFLQFRSHPEIPDYNSYVVQPKHVSPENELQNNTILENQSTLISSVVNFRDIGGYLTTDGKRVKQGTIFRSGDFSKLDSGGLKVMEDVGIKTIFDLRHSGEIAESPNNMPKSIRQLHIPIYEKQEEPGGFWETISRYNLDSYWDNFYINTLVTDNAKNFGRIIEEVASHDDLPIVIHCTAGKDRTGIAVALILLAIGVPEETVIADYTLSNKAFPEILIRAEGKFQKHRLAVSMLNMKAIDVYPFFLAKNTTISKTLEHIKRNYGTYQQYLIEAAGVDVKTIELLKERLLENLQQS